MIASHIRALAELFATACGDAETLSELSRMASDYRSWSKAHALFDRIRRKTIKAEKARDKLLLAQYFFEESCAKTMYNLSNSSAPFDGDSPYWVIPAALVLAQRLSIDVQKIVAVIAAEPYIPEDAPQAARP